MPVRRALTALHKPDTSCTFTCARGHTHAGQARPLSLLAASSASFQDTFLVPTMRSREAHHHPGTAVGAKALKCDHGHVRLFSPSCPGCLPTLLPVSCMEGTCRPWDRPPSQTFQIAHLRWASYTEQQHLGERHSWEQLYLVGSSQTARGHPHCHEAEMPSHKVLPSARFLRVLQGIPFPSRSLFRR